MTDEINYDGLDVHDTHIEDVFNSWFEEERKPLLDAEKKSKEEDV